MAGGGEFLKAHVPTNLAYADLHKKHGGRRGLTPKAALWPPHAYHRKHTTALTHGNTHIPTHAKKNKTNNEYTRQNIQQFTKGSVSYSQNLNNKSNSYTEPCHQQE